MKRILLSSIGFVLSVGVFGQDQEYNWSRSITTTNSYGVVRFVNSNNNFDSNPTISYPVATFQRGGVIGATYSSEMNISLSRYENNHVYARSQADFKLSHGSVGYPEVTVMSLRSNGNVGIGETIPEARLHISTPSSNSEILRLKPDLTNRYFSILNYSDGTYNDAGTKFYKASTVGQFRFSNMNGDLLTIDKEGNVGIGITNPDVKLEIDGVLKTTGNVDAGGNVIARGYIYSTGTLHLSGGKSGIYNNNRDGWLYWFNRNTSGSEAVVDLDHIGTINTNGNATSFGGNVVSHGYIYSVGSLYLDGGTSHIWDKSKEDWLKWFNRNTSGSEAVVDLDHIGSISAAGVINIGDKSPTINDYKLSVDGTIRTTEVIVTTENWADYVFKPDYNLRTLTEVENFITENSHLPDVPSEAQVVEKGISLGEMNAILLQKIEELTLYTIEQEKKLKDVETLETRLENLENENEELKRENGERKKETERLQKVETELEELKELINQISK